jgi:16S rRNA (guanine527-N7)-methyltransferase
MYNTLMYNIGMNIAKLSDEKIIKLRRFAVLLCEFNAHVRIVGPSDPETLYDEHVADALAGLPFLAGRKSFVDVGTGGGLPGLVWAICRPDMSANLIDSVAKKIAILREIAGELCCQNVTIVNARSEDFSSRNRESFDVATARAVADSRVLAEYLSPLVRTGGMIVAFKGPAVRKEVDIPGRKWRILGLSEPELHAYSIAGRDRYVVVWEKIGACHARYPRKPGMAEKRPWCGRIG